MGGLWSGKPASWREVWPDVVWCQTITRRKNLSYRVIFL